MTRMLHIGWIIGLIGAAGGWSQPPQEIFVSTGEHGEVSFSDVAEPGAERVEVTVPEPPENAEEELVRRMEQTLAVARALEASRLAREKTRAEARREAARAVSETTLYEDRYVAVPYVFRGPYAHRFARDSRFHHHGFHEWPHGKHGERDREPAERTISRRFLYDGDRR